MIEIGRICTVIVDKKEFAPQFHDILGERVVVTGEKYLSKYPVYFIDRPELSRKAQRVREDLLLHF